MIDDIAAPNGLAFTPDERGLYVVESRAEPHRKIWLYDHAADGRLSNKRLYVDAQGPGAYDGIAVDAAGQRLVRLRQQRRDRAPTPRRWTACASTTRRQGHRPHPPARALRQPVLRRREEQPPVHGGEPFAVCAVRQRAGGGLGKAIGLMIFGGGLSKTGRVLRRRDAGTSPGDLDCGSPPCPRPSPPTSASTATRARPLRSTKRRSAPRSRRC